MLNNHDYFDRQVRAAVWELDDLQRNRFTVRKLSEPLQRGWQRIFVLTTHAEERKDRPILEAILREINTERRCRRPDFRTRQHRTRALIEIEQSLQCLWDRKFEATGSPSAWIPYFHWVHYSQWGVPRYYGDFRQPSLFELHVQPWFVWHVKEVDPGKETRIEELEKWLEWSGGWKRYFYLHGKPNAWRKGTPDPRSISLKKAHDRSMRKALLDPSEAEAATSTRRGRVSFRDLTLRIHQFLALVAQ